MTKTSPANQIWETVKMILRGILSVLKAIGSTIATIIMVGIITGCIVASVLTVYVLQSIGAEKPISLDSIPMGYTSIIVAYDKNGNEVELERLYDPDNNRIPISFDQINDYTKKAMIGIEDKRFYEHQGVDWIRTGGAFLNMLVPIGSTQGGGSTIHQQLIKNVTGDDELRIDRKVREIFRALNLAQNYTHDQVLEAYLNVVSFGAGTSGIQAAANVYFGKDAKDLTLAESAAIVGITQKPTAYNPLLYPEENKKRQEWVLHEMFTQKLITEEEYNQAINEKLHFKENVTIENKMKPNSYFVDYVIDAVIEDLMEQKGLTQEQAANDLFIGGYKIYTTVDIEMQDYLEKFYLDEANFPPINKRANDEYPQSNCVIIDLNGAIKAMVGGRGTKTESRSFNRASQAKRQPGSTFKPIGPYAYAMEYNLITPSTIIEDSPTNPQAPKADQYPKNYYGEYRGPTTVEKAIYNSVNTVAVKVTELVTPASLFDFYYYDLGITSLLDPEDINISPMALGGVTEGVTTVELVGAYQALANGGLYTPPYAYTKVVDSAGHTVIGSNMTPRRVLSEDTAYLLNKMIQNVVTVGTGTHAQIPGMPTAGKTGTSNDDVDQWFIGATPYYVAGVWLGYDIPVIKDKYGKKVKNSVMYYPHPYPTPPLWRSIMEPLHEGLEPIPFKTDDELVVKRSYCTITGELAGSGCPTASTWYKTSNLPPTCAGHAAAAPAAPAAADGGGEVLDSNPVG